MRICCQPLIEVVIRLVISWGSLCLLGLSTWGARDAQAQEFAEEIERQIVLRSHQPLQVSNSRGDITVIGWTQDKIRIKAHRKATAEDEAQARKLLSAADLVSRTEDGRVELVAEYGNGLSLEEKLKERSNPRTSMEMIVYAPSDLALKIWTVQGKVTLKNWHASTEVRTQSGPVQISGVRGDNISVLCQSCRIQAESIRGALRCMGGEGAMVLRDVAGPSIYTESLTGEVRASRVEGDQLYVSRSGSVFVQDSRGRIEFHLQQGSFELLNGNGFLSGKTSSGNVSARMREWTFADKALIETVSGNVNLVLPPQFVGELDLWSRQGKVESGFSLIKPSSGGLEPAASAAGSRQTGLVGAGGEMLRIYSEKGFISVKPGA